MMNQVQMVRVMSIFSLVHLSPLTLHHAHSLSSHTRAQVTQELRSAEEEEESQEDIATYVREQYLFLSCTSSKLI